MEDAKRYEGHARKTNTIGNRVSLAPADFTEPEILFKQLKSKITSYHPSTDITMIEKAYNLAHEAHKGQKRKSGEPYIVHPLCGKYSCGVRT